MMMVKCDEECLGQSLVGTLIRSVMVTSSLFDTSFLIDYFLRLRVISARMMRACFSGD